MQPSGKRRGAAAGAEPRHDGAGGERVAGNPQRAGSAAQIDAAAGALDRATKALNAYTEACNLAATASGNVAKALGKLDGTEAVVTIRFAVNDTAVTAHPLLGEDVAASEAALVAMAEAGPLGKAARGDLT